MSETVSGRVASDRAGGPSDPSPSVSAKGAHPSRETLYCSFCAKTQHEVRKLIAGPTVFICDECVELCNDIVAAESREPTPTPELCKWAWHSAGLALSSGNPTPESIEAMAEAALRFVMKGPRARDSDASLAEDGASRLSPEGVAARAEGIAQGSSHD